VLVAHERRPVLCTKKKISLSQVVTESKQKSFSHVAKTETKNRRRLRNSIGGKTNRRCEKKTVKEKSLEEDNSCREIPSETLAPDLNAHSRGWDTDDGQSRTGGRQRNSRPATSTQNRRIRPAEENRATPKDGAFAPDWEMGTAPNQRDGAAKREPDELRWKNFRPGCRPKKTRWSGKTRAWRRAAVEKLSAGLQTEENRSRDLH
jgi:hypothetical protein